MNGPLLRGLDRAGFVDRLANHVHDASQGLGANWNRDGFSGIDNFLAADQPLGRVHGNGADGVLAEMLRHFEHQTVALVVGLERVQNRREIVCRTARRPRRP